MWMPMVLKLLMLADVINAVVITKILTVEKSGCVAQLETDAGVKWIYLYDDYRLVSNST